MPTLRRRSVARRCRAVQNRKGGASPSATTSSRQQDRSLGRLHFDQTQLQQLDLSPTRLRPPIAPFPLPLRALSHPLLPIVPTLPHQKFDHSLPHLLRLPPLNLSPSSTLIHHPLPPFVLARFPASPTLVTRSRVNQRLRSRACRPNRLRRETLLDLPSHLSATRRAALEELRR